MPQLAQPDHGPRYFRAAFTSASWSVDTTAPLSIDAAGKPVLRAPRGTITLRKLLTHTAGFVYDTWNKDMNRYAAETGLPAARTARLEALSAPLGFDPGTRWEYGINIDIVNRHIEIGAPDLLTIGDGASLGGRLVIANAEIVGNELVIGTAEIGADALWIAHDHVLAAMVEGLGGTATPVERPFRPEGGAYAGGHAQDHGHGHHHHHDHPHDHAHG